MRNNRNGTEQVLQTCLNLIQTGQETVDSVLVRYPEHANVIRPLLEAASWLYGQRDALAPRPGFVVESRQRLVARLEVERSSNRAQAPPARAFGWWDALVSLFTQKRFAYRFALATLLLVLLVVSTSGVAAAAQWSIPGDTLYPVKTSFEQTRLALTFSEAHRAQLYISFAERRLVEIQNLVIENRFDYLHSTIDQFDSQAKEASRLLRDLGKKDAPLAMKLAGELEKIMQDQTAVLPVLMQVTPQGSQGEIQRLMEMTLDVKVEAASIEARPAGTLTPTATAILDTATPSSSAAGSPTPNDTSTAVPTATPMPETAIPPTPTPYPWSTPVPTVIFPVTAGTPVPTTISGGEKPPQPVITEEPPAPQPTRKPKKLHPVTTRRPPKKTKTPRD